MLIKWSKLCGHFLNILFGAFLICKISRTASSGSEIIIEFHRSHWITCPWSGYMFSLRAYMNLYYECMETHGVELEMQLIKEVCLSLDFIFQNCKHCPQVHEISMLLVKGNKHVFSRTQREIYVLRLITFTPTWSKHNFNLALKQFFVQWYK